MTKDQITRLAKEAGIRNCTCDGDFGCIERFAALIAKREWVGLTDEEIQEIALEVPMDAVRITEAKLKEKNT